MLRCCGLALGSVRNNGSSGDYQKLPMVSSVDSKVASCEWWQMLSFAMGIRNNEGEIAMSAPWLDP